MGQTVVYQIVIFSAVLLLLVGSRSLPELCTALTKSVHLSPWGFRWCSAVSLRSAAERYNKTQEHSRYRLPMLGDLICLANSECRSSFTPNTGRARGDQGVTRVVCLDPPTSSSPVLIRMIPNHHTRKGGLTGKNERRPSRKISLHSSLPITCRLQSFCCRSSAWTESHCSKPCPVTKLQLGI